jgi:hypothetical protein
MDRVTLQPPILVKSRNDSTHPAIRRISAKSLSQLPSWPYHPIGHTDSLRRAKCRGPLRRLTGHIARSTVHSSRYMLIFKPVSMASRVAGSLLFSPSIVLEPQG